MTPEVVVFDLGKVLLDFDYSIAAKTFASTCKLDLAQVRDAIDQSPLLFEYETGKLTSQEFYSRICGRIGFKGTFDEFCVPFGDIFVEIAPMVELHRRLRQAGIPTYIFSNTNEIAINHIRKRFPFFNHFDGYVLSYEQGSMKPDPRIYAAVESMTDEKGAAIVYIDDRSENIAVGMERDWIAIHHGLPGPTIAQVENLFSLPA